MDDLFLNACEKDEMYDQHFNGVVIKRIKARDLYNLIMESCYHRAEPGVLFYDNMQKNNPISYLGKTNATNPCFGRKTPILTDKGSFLIRSIVGKPVKIWDGSKWSKTEFKVTGKNKEIHCVTLRGKTLSGDNISFDPFFSTLDHNVILGDNTKKQIGDLCIGMTVRHKDTVVTLDVVETKLIGIEDRVYCCKVPSSGMFSLANGLMVSNCGEISGLPTLTTVCLLGSLNLTQYVEIKDDSTYFDWEQYGKDIQVFARMLDNVCDLSNAPLPSYTWAIKNLRQFGMGLNGLGSALMMLGIPYNSKEAVDFSKKIAKIKENLTWQVSANLAKEKGVFPAYDKKKFEDTEYFKSDRLSDEIKGLLKRYGARNGKTTTCAPAGSSSILVDNVSNSIEPVFRVEYDRKMVCKDWPEGLTRENIKTALTYHKKKDYEYWEGIYNNKKYYYEPQNRGLCEITLIRDYGYQWLLDNFPKKDHGKYLITTKDLTVDDHLAIQEVIQRFNNQSTSKTVNVPNKYPFKDFKDIYLTGWKKGLVGLTTYREGSMESVLSSIEEERTIIKKDLKLPNTFINGPTSVIKKEGMKFYIHFSYFPDDTELKHPVCLWIYTNSEEKGAPIVCNKASRELVKLALSCGIDNKIIAPVIDKCKMDYPHNRLGRVISMCLRHNIPREDILGALYNIEGDNISTLLFSVRKFISSTMTDGTKIKNFKCPSCKGDNLVYQGGCYSCCDCHAVGC
jgi:ribonucleotide reductase alpha subunit